MKRLTSRPNPAKSGVYDLSWPDFDHLVARLNTGSAAIWQNDTPIREREMLASDRFYFTNALANIHPDVLEYMIRRQMPIHLNAFYSDSLDYTSQQKLKSGSQRVNSGSRIATVSRSFMTSAITVGGISDSSFWSHAFYHEAAHDISNKDKSKPFREDLVKLANTVIQNMPEGNSLAFPELIHSITFGTPLDYTLKGFLLPPAQFYPSLEARANEIACDMLALSFGPLEGQKGKDLLRAHYKDHPEFADKVIALRDTVRSIFDERLAQLRAEKDLPAELVQRTMRR